MVGNEAGCGFFRLIFVGVFSLRGFKVFIHFVVVRQIRNAD